MARALEVAEFFGLLGKVVDELGGADGDYGVVGAVDEEEGSGGNIGDALGTGALA